MIKYRFYSRYSNTLQNETLRRAMNRCSLPAIYDAFPTLIMVIFCKHLIEAILEPIVKISLRKLTKLS